MIENLISSNNLMFTFNFLTDLSLKDKIINALSAYKMQIYISIGNHSYFDKIEKITLLAHSFYKSKSLFLRGEYAKALTLIDKFNKDTPNHNEGIYLQCSILRAMNEKNAAWMLLKNHSLISKRNKTLINLSSMVSNKEEYSEFNSLIKDINLNYSFSKIQKCGWLANAAFRAGLPEEAVNLWKKCYLDRKTNTPPRNNINKIIHGINQICFRSLAEKALIDFHHIMNKENTKFFLISGTLLGLIRENRLLKHDKDIDVGVFLNEVDQLYLIDKLSKSGFFYETPARSTNLLKFKHVNGTEIDVFFHLSDKDSCWHEGVKLRWHNTPFDLELTEFLGRLFFIPKDFNLYLTENYGNWKHPVHKFDCALDTPNAKINNKYEAAAYGYACILRNKGRVNEYLSLIEKTQLL